MLDSHSLHLNISVNMDAITQTPMKRASTTVPDAPKQKAQKPNWMDCGRDIRRNLFVHHNWGKMDDVKDKRWAILKVDTIATSTSHRCIRRFYIGDKDGSNYLEMEFYPCVSYKNLADNYKEQYYSESANGHGLRYNPYQRSPPCSVAVSKINEFIVYNGIEIILFNVENDSYHEKVNLAICDELAIQRLNIHWSPVDYAPAYKRQLAHETDRVEDFRSGDDDGSWTVQDYVDNY